MYVDGQSLMKALGTLRLSLRAKLNRPTMRRNKICLHC